MSASSFYTIDEDDVDAIRVTPERGSRALVMGTRDPAVTRRAAEILVFGRPGATQRRELLSPNLAQLGFQAAEIDAIVDATGPREGRFGFTFSDLAQRLIPAIVLDAYPDRAIVPERALQIAEEMVPTPPFSVRAATAA